MSVTKVVLAKLSPTMEEGKIVRWAKQEGDAVKIGDVLAEIETDKANMEMEALGEGTLRKVLVPAGRSAPVGSLIGVIAGPDDDIAPVIAAAEAESAAGTESPGEAASEPPEPAEAPEQPAEPEAPQPEAPQAEAPEPAPAPVEPAKATLEATGSGDRRVKASPLARRLAADRGIALESVPGSGPGGRVIRRDVEGYRGPTPAAPRAAAPATESAPAPVSAPAEGPQPGDVIALSGMRRTIAKRLSESKFTAPHFYVTVEIDMDAAMRLREQILAASGTKVSVNDLVLRACALALRLHPMVNASWTADSIAVHADVHLGVAVAIPDGLITPVVRDADRKSVTRIGQEVRDLASRARDKKLRPEEFSGSTFTVSNLGMYDVTDFTAIINPPESAILAVGSVRRVPVVDGDAVRPGERMRVTLSSDHRVVDGALAARFLADVRRLLENPLALLV